MVIDGDVALGRNARVLGEADICPHARRYDDQLRRNARAVHEGDAGCVDARGIRVFQQLHAFARHGGFKVLRRLRVNLPLHQLIAVLQHGHRQARFRQGRCRFQPQHAAADNRRVFCRFRDFPHARHIAKGSHGNDVRAVRARNRRHEAACACRQNEGIPMEGGTARHERFADGVDGSHGSPGKDDNILFVIPRGRFNRQILRRHLAHELFGEHRAAVGKEILGGNEDNQRVSLGAAGGFCRFEGGDASADDEDFFMALCTSFL